MERFRFLEHTSDIYAEAYGRDLEEALENIALAMFETMTDTSKIRPKTSIPLTVGEPDLESLIYSWLEQLLLKFEIEGWLFSEFKVEKIIRDKAGLKLNAQARGEPFNPDVHPSKVEIKAVTYHLMKILQEGEKATIRVLFDI